MGYLPQLARAMGLVLVAFVIPACTSTAPEQAPTALALTPTSAATLVATAAPAGQPALASFDQRFIDMMVPHHEGAVEMARVAEARAQHPEIKTLATDILQSQGAEIQQMRAWRQQWFGSSQTPPLDHMPWLGPMVDTAMAMNADGSVDMSKDVTDLGAAPEPFDAAFIEVMIPHHQMAISAARLAFQQAEHTEVDQLASAIVDAQQREIGQMQGWRLQWYGSMRADMNAPTPTPGPARAPTPMQDMPGMMNEGH